MFDQFVNGVLPWTRSANKSYVPVSNNGQPLRKGTERIVCLVRERVNIDLDWKINELAKYGSIVKSRLHCLWLINPWLIWDVNNPAFQGVCLTNVDDDKVELVGKLIHHLFKFAKFTNKWGSGATPKIQD